MEEIIGREIGKMDVDRVEVHESPFLALENIFLRVSVA